MLGPCNGREVYVITDLISVQVLSIATAKMVGLDTQEILQALNFEAEALSGIDPFGAISEAIPLGEFGGERQYWLSQIASSEFNNLVNIFATHDSILGGVVHAGGLPRDTESDSVEAAWQRIEVWSEVVVCIDASASGAFKLHLIPGSANWEMEMEAWFQNHDKSIRRQRWVSGARFAGGGGNPALDDETILRAFLTGWADELSNAIKRVPIVRPTKPPIGAATRWAVGGALAAIVVIICGSHRFFITERIKELELAIRDSQKPAEQLQQLRGENAELEKQRLVITDETSRLKLLHDDLSQGVSREHRRHLALLKGLLNTSPETLLIESIKEKQGELQLGGISMTPESPGFGEGMAEIMEPFFWRLEPPQRKAMCLAENGAPWQLDWVLHLVGDGVTNSINPVIPMAANSSR